MRVNIYKEELSERIEVIEKTPDGQTFVGCRFYLELPVTKEVNGGLQVHRGPFMHRPGDDDSAAVTFWHDDPRQLSELLRRAADALSMHADSHKKSGG